MIWFWAVGYLAVACGVAYLVGRFGDSDMRDKVPLVAGAWPIMTAVLAPFLFLEFLTLLCRVGEGHRK